MPTTTRRNLAPVSLLSPVLKYDKPLFAVAIRLPNGELKLCNMPPQERRLAKVYADVYNRFSEQTGIKAYLCPAQTVVNASDVPAIPALVVLDPDGEVVHEGPADECRIIADEFNRLNEAEPTGQTATVVAKGGA